PSWAARPAGTPRAPVRAKPPRPAGPDMAPDTSLAGGLRAPGTRRAPDDVSRDPRHAGASLPLARAQARPTPCGIPDRSMPADRGRLLRADPRALAGPQPARRRVDRLCGSELGPEGGRV